MYICIRYGMQMYIFNTDATWTWAKMATDFQLDV